MNFRDTQEKINFFSYFLPKFFYCNLTTLHPSVKNKFKIYSNASQQLKEMKKTREWFYLWDNEELLRRALPWQCD